MQKLTGQITKINEVTENGDYKSVRFLVKEVDVQYPQSCLFTKTAKGDNRKYIEEFEKNNPVGTMVEVEYSLKTFEFKGRDYIEAIAFKVVKQ